MERGEFGKLLFGGQGVFPPRFRGGSARSYDTGAVPRSEVAVHADGVGVSRRSHVVFAGASFDIFDAAYLVLAIFSLMSATAVRAHVVFVYEGQYLGAQFFEPPCPRIGGLAGLDVSHIFDVFPFVAQKFWRFAFKESFSGKFLGFFSGGSFHDEVREALVDDGHTKVSLLHFGLSSS